jgi:ABC-type transport system substrate-binding protein
VAAPFEASPAEGNDTFFQNRLRTPDSAAPAEITERLYDSREASLAALRRGEIDVIDRIFPADHARLASDRNFVVARYVMPTLHMLVPTPGRPMSASRTLRRALAYAIDREGILEQQLLGGEPAPGCRLLSGPFSPGVIDNDPLAYAVDPQIEPRPHDLRLAAALVGLAKREFLLEAEQTKKKAPEVALVLGHPASPVARIACEAIASQLELVGLACTLHAFPPGETRDLKNECDFVYCEITLAEPVVDARRLLAADGIARLQDPYINLALRRLDVAPNWPLARERLKDLHRHVHADVSIIPLWQIVEHYARRAELQGLDGPVVTLYENVQAWQATSTTTIKVSQEKN